MATNRWNGSIPVAFLIGLGAGAALGMLFAPKAGQEIRKDIAETVKEGLDEMGDHGADLGRRAKKTFENAKDRVCEAAEAGGQAYRESKTASA